MKHRNKVQEVEKILIYITNSVACKLKLLSVLFFRCQIYTKNRSPSPKSVRSPQIPTKLSTSASLGPLTFACRRNDFLQCFISRQNFYRTKAGDGGIWILHPWQRIARSWYNEGHSGQLPRCASSSYDILDNLNTFLYSHSR